MNNTQEFKFTTGVVAYPIFMVFLLWVVFWIEVRFSYNFNYLGIVPREVQGLRGILFSPFVHTNVTHLYHNSIPLLVLFMALLYFYRKIAWKILGFGIIFSGLLTWLIGRPSFHIGASALIYVLFSFILFKGIFTKHYRLIALSLFVVFLYGSMIWYVFPVEGKISWEGHLSGFATGFLFALIFRKSVVKPKRYNWEQEGYNEEDDLFLKHFDEDGNFIEFPIEDDNREKNELKQ